MSVSIQVVSNRFPALEGQLDGISRRVLSVGVTTLISTAMPQTPVDTGALRANVTTEIGANDATVTWNQHYAAFVHEGTYKMPARPFARNAAPAAAAAMKAAMGGLG